MIDFSAVTIDPSWAFKVPPTIAHRRLVLPLCLVDGVLQVAMANPQDETALNAIRDATGQEVNGLAADREELRAELLRIYGDARAMQQHNGESGDPVAIVDQLLRAAALRRASDIHFNPSQDGLFVRMRIDGRLEDFTRLSIDMAPSVSSRLKILSGLDIAERRAPQDGGFTWRMQQRNASSRRLDVRVATLPVRYGERITLRLLESDLERLSLPATGLSNDDIAAFRGVLSKPQGLVLLTGPTGSGKTTTLYAAIQELLASEPLNILTVEDPIEYEIEGVSQAEVDSNDKVNFTKALRSLLRHDPDVIMIGEIRDSESLDIAVKAALTGHLVLSTLHTNDAVSAVTRLLDMGLQPHMIAATLRMSMAQRLVRRLCPNCRMAYAIPEREAALLGLPELAGRSAFKAKGCLACAGRGYKGRTGIFELMIPSASVLSRIASGASQGELSEEMRACGMRTLIDDASDKLTVGITDFAEILRTIGYL